jgi:rRNA maturation endonuclease Nob1
MKNYRNIDTNKKTTEDTNKGNVTFTAGDYSYYSKVLKKPFNTVAELKEAEAAYFAEQKAKEDKAAVKKADAEKVQDAFKALNAARKTFKEDNASLDKQYREGLKQLKDKYEESRKVILAKLENSETAYAAALKAFTDKYPEGYHITLKDGDFETTIDNRIGSVTATNIKPFCAFDELLQLLF